MAKQDEPINDDDAMDAEEFGELSDLLLLHISQFVEEHDIGDDLLPVMLMQLAVSTRMMAYVVSVDKPSGFGLKLDLDRFRRDIDDVLRVMKKDADQYVAEAREALTKAAEEGEDG
jgi:hypothetical protein